MYAIAPCFCNIARLHRVDTSRCQCDCRFLWKLNAIAVARSAARNLNGDAGQRQRFGALYPRPSFRHTACVLGCACQIKRRCSQGTAPNRVRRQSERRHQAYHHAQRYNHAQNFLFHICFLLWQFWNILIDCIKQCSLSI
ncbi:hypothetical protein SDC9_150752 [bioreactor metagenome]|uniref:Uncharacterized protein n=1 Tax=bioreactor metagenome TaxID=1076179 RepID=A0A645EQH7_9ZZZZ